MASLIANLGLGRPSPSSSPRGTGRHPRKSSQAAYTVFDAGQIQTFKEAFSLIDQDSDGLISEADLKFLFTSLGQVSTNEQIKCLLACRPTSFDASISASTKFNFSTFVTMMAEHLSEMDSETDLLEAFASFDEDDKGFLYGPELRKWLKEVGDTMSDEELDTFLNGPFTDRRGNFNYRHFCRTLRVTDVDAAEA